MQPDPQAFRPPEEPLNVRQVRLPTHFKVASFPSAVHTNLLRRLQADIEAIRHTVDGQAVALHIERVDRLVQAVAGQHGLRHPAVDKVVALVDAQLERKRMAQN